MTAPDTNALLTKLSASTDLSDLEKAYLREQLTAKKKYGLIWEDKPELVEQQLLAGLPVLTEVPERHVENVQRPASSVQRPASSVQQSETAQGTLDLGFPEEETRTIAEETHALPSPRSVSSQTETVPPITHHTLIEGDNLHALTVLNYTHAGQVDVIYIDPPYNTGNKDFKYNDTFVDREDSYRHSKWLSFMAKRLRLAKTLLKDTGVIFISIDDNEQAQLKLLCDEVFGEGNFVADVIWQSRKSVSNDAFISLAHNYTLIYAKNLSILQKEDFRLPVKSEKFANPDNDPRGLWVADPFDAPNLRPNLTYAIINPNTKEEYWPPKGRCWRTTEQDYKRFLSDNRIVFGKKGTSKPQFKRFLTEAEDKGSVITTIWNDIETTTNGTQLLMSILDDNKFNNPKPLGLLDRILKLAAPKNALVLDFFAGSGTTLHAVMALNAEDGGNRRCILVTNNENNIAEEVCYERNRRVISGYVNSKGVDVPGLAGNALRYYRTALVGREKTLANKRALMRQATDLLCLKEGC